MAQEELQESKLTKAGGRKPTHGCNYPMVGWPSVILTPMGPSLNLTREGTSRPSLRSSLSLSLYSRTLHTCLVQAVATCGAPAILLQLLLTLVGGSAVTKVIKPLMPA